jgi:hypothetical protein
MYGPLQTESDKFFLVTELNMNMSSKSTIENITKDIRNVFASFQEIICSYITYSGHGPMPS